MEVGSFQVALFHIRSFQRLMDSLQKLEIEAKRTEISRMWP